MISAGEVGALFKISDEATPVLQRIISELTAVQGAVDRTKLSLAELRLPPGVARSLGNMTSALGRLDAAAASASTAMKSGFAGADVAVDRTISRVGVLRQELRAAGAAARGIHTGSIRTGGGSAGGGGGGSGHGSGRGGLFHANARVPLGGEAHASSSDTGIIAGLMAAGTAVNVFEKGSGVRSAEERLRLGNIPSDKIEAAKRQAALLGSQYGFGIEQLLDMDNEIRNPLGGIDKAMEHLPSLVKAMNVLRGMDTKRGGDGKVAEEAYDLVKSAEFRNAIQPEEYDNAISSMVRATAGTGGKVTPKDWLQFSKYSRGALPGLSGDFLYTVIPEMIQEFGGAAEGTSLASLYQQIIAGQMRTTGMNLLDQLGYIDPSKVKRDQNGRIVSLLPGANTKAGEFQQEPALFAANLVQELSKKISDDPNLQRQWIAQIFGNRNAAAQLNSLAFQSGRINRGADAIKGTKGSDEGSDELLKNDGWTAWERLKSSFGNELGLIGDKSMPLFAGLFNRAADAIGRQNDAMTSAHPLWPTAWGPYPFGAAGGAAAAAPPMPYSLDYYQRRAGEIRADPEAHRASVMGSKSFAEATKQAAPNVNVDVKAPIVTVTANVTLDGAAIAAAVSKDIKITPGSARVTNDANGFDGRQNEQYPDHGFH